MKIPIAKQKVFLQDFESKRPDYEDFSNLLREILTIAASKIDSFAMVQVRVKDLSSFISKIISKDKYTNPLVEMTDLCGARVILHFQSQVDKMCLFIKENFIIDEVNSLDAKSRLKISEFGYRSIHYIISLKGDSLLNTIIDRKFKSMKAEIQVRTFAEHIWASISHDRIYKTKFNLPDEWRREAARLSAVLENADISFGKMSNEIDTLNRIYELQYEIGKADIEIEKLYTIISLQKKDVIECAKNILILTTLLLAKDKFSEAKSNLSEWLDWPTNSPFLNAKLRFEYGMVLCLSKFHDIDSLEYAEGIEILQQTIELFKTWPKELLTENMEEISYLYYRFGRLIQQNSGSSNEALNFISKAQHLIPDNPLYFVAMMEAVVLRNIDMAQYNIILFKSNIYSTIGKLKELIEIGIDNVTALFAIGRCYFFLNDKAECLSAYSRAVHVLINEKFITSQFVVDTEIFLVKSMKHINLAIANQLLLYLNIAMFVSKMYPNKTHYKNYLEKHKLKNGYFKTPVIIIAGGASLMESTKVEYYEEYIKELLYNFKGTIISGGTTSGIPGMVGRLKKELLFDSSQFLDLIAYLPKNLPGDATKSKAYDSYYELDTCEFSALEILTMWNDLVINGINPNEVILIGIEGGIITRMEYQIALSLGAKVCLVNYSGRATSDFLKDNKWNAFPNLFQLPEDPLTVWALANQTTETSLSNIEIEVLGPQVHEFYRQKKIKELNPDSTDVNKFKVLMPWDKLDSSLRSANLKQILFYEHIFKRVNLRLRKSSNPKLFDIRKNLTEQEFELLGKLEHARWNIERLMDGWRYGKEKDLVKKLNPNIVAWKELDNSTRQYDFDPYENISFLLAKVGYEIYKA